MSIFKFYTNRTQHSLTVQNRGPKHYLFCRSFIQTSIFIRFLKAHRSQNQALSLLLSLVITGKFTVFCPTYGYTHWPASYTTASQNGSVLHLIVYKAIVLITWLPAHWGMKASIIPVTNHRRAITSKRKANAEQVWGMNRLDMSTLLIKCSDLWVIITGVGFVHCDHRCLDLWHIITGIRSLELHLQVLDLNVVITGVWIRKL